VTLGIAAALFVAAAPLASQAKYEVRLKRAWVRKFADRATVDATMEVRHTHRSANQVESGGKDGDLHFSGVSADIGLPFVAEVVNARQQGQLAAIQVIKDREASGDLLSITGAWRLWFEHPAKRQTQGGRNAFHPDNTNPDHSFEIHPASKIDDEDVSGAFIPIQGYEAYSADVAFPYFESSTVTIKASRTGISIRSKKLKYNYVEFDAELAEAPREVADGFIVKARFLDDDGEQVGDGFRRLIFVGETDAAEAIQDVAAGDFIRVLAIPRLDLNAVLEMVARQGTRQFEARLPYEMIVVGVIEQ